MSNGKKRKGKGSHWSITVLKWSWANVGFILIRFQGLGIFPGSQLHPFSDPCFFTKGSTCLQLSTFISLLVSAASFHFVFSLALLSQLATRLLYTFLKKFVGPKSISPGFTPLDKSYTHKSFWDNPLSVLTPTDRPES